MSFSIPSVIRPQNLMLRKELNSREHSLNQMTLINQDQLQKPKRGLTLPVFNPMLAKVNKVKKSSTVN